MIKVEIVTPKGYAYSGEVGTIKRVRLAGETLEVEWDDPPWRFEAGTPPIIEGIGLAEAARFLLEIGMANIERHEHGLTAQLIEDLQSIPGVSIVGPGNARERKGIVAFNVEGYNPDSVGVYLGANRIAVRTGTHCADILYQQLGLHGSVRASLYVYNCPWDVDRLISTLKRLVSQS
jgi:cysteine desulfurase/selenocysteine lyase